MTTNGKPRLGGWTKIGIVASVLWVLGAWIAAFDAREEAARNAFIRALGICAEQQQFEQLDKSTPQQQQKTNCVDRADKARQSVLDQPFYAVTALSVYVPLLFFWLLVWLIRASYRWVRRGFSPKAHATSVQPPDKMRVVPTLTSSFAPIQKGRSQN